jgi:hypothetical protein
MGKALTAESPGATAGATHGAAAAVAPTANAAARDTGPRRIREVTYVSGKLAKYARPALSTAAAATAAAPRSFSAATTSSPKSSPTTNSKFLDRLGGDGEVA